MDKNEKSELEVRIDKWLWAARFFKTRALATDAINGGKVHMNGGRVKPSRHVKVGAKLEITRPQCEQTVIVLDLSDRRGPAPVAQLLYEETEASIKKRAEVAEMMKNTPKMDRAIGKPTKKNRRNIIRFKNIHSE